MEIEDTSGLKLRLNVNDHVASVIKSSKSTGNIFIPRFIQHEGNDYKIISIDEEAFSQNKIESITFPQDSEVQSFKKDAFLQASIKKLQIPSSLKIIEGGCFFLVTDLVDIEVSPENKLFSYVDNKYLVRKSDVNSDNYDILIYGRYDIEDAEIPSFVKVLKRHSFNNNLKSLKFPENSQIEAIEFGVINKSFKKLTIPQTLKQIDQNSFQLAHNLVEIEVSPKNEFFSYIDDKYLLTKSDTSIQKVFDQIIFCRRDVKDVKIPKYIKKIGVNAFSRCNRLETVLFESDSSLEMIDGYAFSWSSKVEQITVPSSVKIVGSCAFCNMSSLKSIEFLSDVITVEDCCFQLCNKLETISFPNATKIFIDGPISKDTKIVVKKDVELSGDLSEDKKECFIYEGEENTENLLDPLKKILVEEEEEKNENEKDEIEGKPIIISKKKFDELIKHVRFIEKHLSKFEDIEEFDFDSIIIENQKQTEEEEDEVKEIEKKNENENEQEKPDETEKKSVKDDKIVVEEEEVVEEESKEKEVKEEN